MKLSHFLFFLQKQDNQKGYAERYTHQAYEEDKKKKDEFNDNLLACTGSKLCPVLSLQKEIICDMVICNPRGQETMILRGLSEILFYAKLSSDINIIYGVYRH